MYERYSDTDLFHEDILFGLFPILWYLSFLQLNLCFSEILSGAFGDNGDIKHKTNKKQKQKYIDPDVNSSHLVYEI